MVFVRYIVEITQVTLDGISWLFVVAFLCYVSPCVSAVQCSLEVTPLDHFTILVPSYDGVRNSYYSPLCICHSNPRHLCHVDWYVRGARFLFRSFINHTSDSNVELAHPNSDSQYEVAHEYHFVYDP